MIEIKIKYGISTYSLSDISFTFTTKNIKIFIDQCKMIVSTHIDKFPYIYAREHYDTGSLIQWGVYDFSIGRYIGPCLRMCYKLDGYGYYMEIIFNNISGYGMTYDRFMHCYQHNDDELSQLFMKFYNDILQTYRIKK
jgi:hypothetical protein